VGHAVLTDTVIDDFTTKNTRLLDREFIRKSDQLDVNLVQYIM